MSSYRATEGVSQQVLAICFQIGTDAHQFTVDLNSTRFVGQRSCLFHAATSLVAEANASRGVLCPWRPMSHSVL